MNAQNIVDLIGKGVLKALDTNQLFLGIEGGTYENADIHPEYLTTVKVAEELIAAEHVVSLEARMSQLRSLAWRAAISKDIRNQNRKEKIKSTLGNYVFGDKDGQRLDILVLHPNCVRPPILMTEAKLGAQNFAGVRDDIDRIVKLLDMFHAVGSLTDTTYGAVVFHCMEEDTKDNKGKVVNSANKKAESILGKISGHIKTVQSERNWLNASHGLIRSSQKIETASGYHELHEDGSTEKVFAKHGFHFAPGLILLGMAEDVKVAEF